MRRTSYKSNFAAINGIRLHYLDWGGDGTPLLFLTGIGNSARLFDQIAGRFSSEFRVLALTRRGQGESDAPSSGYDRDTLIDDILDFLNLMEIDKVILVGHSFSGGELTYFYQNYPDRILKLVYLDAVYDRIGRSELYASYPLKNVQPPNAKDEFDSLEDYIAHLKFTFPAFAKVWSPAWDKSVAYNLVQLDNGKFRPKDASDIRRQMMIGWQGFDPGLANITCPVLSFVAISTPPPPNWYTDGQKKSWQEFYSKQWIPFQQKEIALFRKHISQAKIVELPDGHHYCFMDQEATVYKEMVEFFQNPNNQSE